MSAIPKYRSTPEEYLSRERQAGTKSEYFRGEVDTLLNPSVLIEVLSPSTADYDRGGKFAHYRRLASLQEYVLISQDRPRVEHYLRQPEDQWLFSEKRSPDDTLVLPTLQCQLPLAEVYLKVRFELSADEA